MYQDKQDLSIEDLRNRVRYLFGQYSETNRRLYQSRMNELETRRTFLLGLFREYRMQELERLWTMQDLGYASHDSRYEYQYSICTDLAYVVWWIEGQKRTHINL